MCALKQWEHYLLSNIFILLIDHFSLKFLNSQNTISRMHARWLQFFQRFDFVIKPLRISLIRLLLLSVEKVYFSPPSNLKSLLLITYLHCILSTLILKVFGKLALTIKNLAKITTSLITFSSNVMFCVFLIHL